MPFIPHTDEDVREMLATIGAPDIEALFAEIPPDLRAGKLDGIPPALSEMAAMRLARERAAANPPLLNFAGAGAYEHHIPAAVWEIAGRGEFYSAYTPYQAEASQGTLQVIYEFQSMICGLTGLDVANASMYDGASALAEAVLMAVRAQRRAEAKRVLLPLSVHPAYRATVRTLCAPQGIEVIDVPYCTAEGNIVAGSLARFANQDIAALVVPQTNYFGVIEEFDALTRWAEAQGAMTIALVNPVALAILKPPGEWGDGGADIACGDGQPLGAPLASGGPYFGFMCAKKAHVRQLPGRIVGRTVDADGKPGFVLTLQAREQHIRRARATSNICSNQGLMATAATIHMALLGPEGLARVAEHCVANTRALVERVAALGVTPVFSGPRFHEVALALPAPAEDVLARMAEMGVLGGVALGCDHPGMDDVLLACATETKTAEDIDRYVQVLASALERSLTAP